MASRAGAAPDWRAAFRRSFRRATHMAGAGILFALLVFLTLALASYTQTDPSPSTAASGEDIRNWMGASGAWASERALNFLGIPAVLLLPLLYISARRLWTGVERDDETETPGRWWGPFAMLLAAVALLGTVLALVFEPDTGSLPAGVGGLFGQLGGLGIEAVAERFGGSFSGWIVLVLALLALGGGVALVTRVFALDWAQFLTLPDFVRRKAQLPDIDLPLAPKKQKRVAAPPAGDDADEPEIAREPRRAPEIADPAPMPAQPRPAKAKQRDMFANFQLPSHDLLDDAPENSAPKLDKMALERNARLLENVLDDFNVKGEITAVRAGPVVTMYELEPAPGIKASRVVGLAEDIARNMSAISARVSPIPGRTVIGIELPNADRQMVSYKQLANSAAFVDHKGSLPMILGKDIAGEPIVADLAAMPHLLVAGTTGSGKSVGLNAILLSLL